MGAQPDVPSPHAHDQQVPEIQASRALWRVRASPLAILGLDVGDLVADAVRALIDLLIPDFAADWATRLVTWLVALPPVTGGAFPSLNRYAHDLTAIGFGLLGATFIASAVQLAAGANAQHAAQALKRAAIAAGMLAFYPTLMTALLTTVNVATAEMIRHPLVEDGLDKAFGEALLLSAATSGVSLGLAAGAAIVVLYFVAALFVMKIGLTAALAVTTISGAIVWGLYPLQQTSWLPRAWGATLIAALAVPVAWACVFSAAVLLAADTLVFEKTGSWNRPLGDGLENLVKPFAAVACFWLAYRAPGFLMSVARAGGMTPSMLGPSRGGGGAGASARGRGPEAIVARGVRTNADRFRAVRHAAATRLSTTRVATAARNAASTAAATRPGRTNTAWRALPDQGRVVAGEQRHAAREEAKARTKDARKAVAIRLTTSELRTPPTPKPANSSATRAPAPKRRTATPKRPPLPTTTSTRAAAATAPPRKPAPSRPASTPRPNPPKPSRPADSRSKPTPSPPKPPPNRTPTPKRPPKNP